MHNRHSSANKEQRAALADITKTLSHMIEQSITANGSAQELAKVNQMLEEASAALNSLNQDKRLVEYYNPKQQNNLNDVLPYSPISGGYNPVAVPIVFSRVGEKTIGEVICGRAYEGPKNSVHGGVISAIYDQLMAIASMMSDQAGPTAYLHVDYKGMTPLFKPLLFEAWIGEVKGRKITVQAHCLHDGKVVSTAHALFIGQGKPMN